MSSNRRGVGLSAFSRNTLTSAQYASHGNTLRTEHLDSLQTQLSVFQQLLHQFSITHGKEIRSNPAFRAEFARMCAAIGVDPLASSHSRGTNGSGSGGGRGGITGTNFWAQMLGGSVNDFYFELAVRLVEVCRETRGENGGMIAVAEVKQRVQKGKGIGGGMEVSEYVDYLHTWKVTPERDLYKLVLFAHAWCHSDDVLRAVKSLEPLGSGFTVMNLGATQMIRSVPRELSTDQSVVLEAIQVLGYVTVSMLQINLQWEQARAVAVIDDLIADSLLWVDKQAEETEFWSPTFIRILSG